MSQHDSAAGVRKKVGLLFVHGIGEQKRWEFLRGTATQFAELMRQTDNKAAVSVTDRTDDWKHAPGEPDTASGAPVSLSVTSANCNIDFECHEVWWADLGSRSGIADVILFWIWGLGQWCAPIYRELDASNLRKDDRDSYNKPVPKIAKLPTAAAGTGWEPRVRLALLLAAIAAACAAATWGLAKKLAGSILGQAPSPTIIVQYVGDVRTYEERAAPGDTALSDPGFPRRVSIRRRMITEMVAMADRGYDEWYVVAHSLGSVLAYNGLTEIGHTLPNYLPQRQWASLSPQYKKDPGCMTREDIDAMMPARPAWLKDTDVINRPLLFANLKGFLTYGSPLNKFAALWPRVVATATDRDPSDPPFTKSCRWINLIAPSDPVAGVLDRFSNKAGSLFEHYIPKVENIPTRWTISYGMAHILYFAGVERFQSDVGTIQKRRVMKWLMGWHRKRINRVMRSPLTIWVQSRFAYYCIVALLLGITAIAVTLAGGLASALFGGATLHKYSNPVAFLHAVCAVFGPMLAVILWAILLAGLWRWFRESSLNVKLAAADHGTKRVGRKKSNLLKQKKPNKNSLWPALTDMLIKQKCASAGIMAGFPLFGIEISASLRDGDWSAPLIAIATAGFLTAVISQTIINRRVGPLKHKGQEIQGMAATEAVAVTTVDKHPFA